MSSTSFTFRAPPDLSETILHAAASRRATVSALIRDAIRTGVSEAESDPFTRDDDQDRPLQARIRHD